MARKRVIKKKEAMKAAIEKAQLTEEKKAAEKAQLTEEKKTQFSDTAKEIKATAKTAARTAVKEAKAAKETVKKTAAKEVKGAQEAVKKTAAKRPSKKDMKVRTFVEYYGKQVEEKEMPESRRRGRKRERESGRLRHWNYMSNRKKALFIM